jgi:dienelactone hydrolase
VTGLRRGSGHRVVILTHQSRGTPCDLAALGAGLADDGYRVVAWTSEHSSSTRTLRLLVEHERRAGATYVALVGASLGAATSLTAGSSVRPPVDAVVALSPSSQSDRAGDVARAAARFRGPLMAVAAQHDPSFADLPPELARLHDGIEEVEVVTGSSDHGKEFVIRSTDPMVERVLAFLAGSGR